MKASPTPAAEKSAASKKDPVRRRLGRLLPASDPVALEIPSIGVKSSNFVDLEVAKDGTLDVPGSADEVGFYTGGPTPGQFGPAVLGAHVDSKKGPGLFYNLGAVKPGDKIHIDRQDKTRLTFEVDKVAVYPNNDFPTEAVYRGDFDKAEIRLVTCAAERSTRSSITSTTSSSSDTSPAETARSSPSRSVGLAEAAPAVARASRRPLRAGITAG